MLLPLGRRAAFSIAAVLLASCGQHAATLPALSPQAIALPDARPPQCKGQQNEKDYATLSVSLKAQGGTLCIPAFGGFGGKLKYPSLSPAIQMTVSSSTQNYNNQPILGSGKPFFYLEFSTSAGTTFGSNLKSGGGLTGSTIVPGQAYTAYGEASVYGYKVKFGPCYTTATKGKYGGVIGGIGALIKGQKIPFKVNGVIELYSGQQTSYGC